MNKLLKAFFCLLFFALALLGLTKSVKADEIKIYPANDDSGTYKMSISTDCYLNTVNYGSAMKTESDGVKTYDQTGGVIGRLGLTCGDDHSCCIDTNFGQGGENWVYSRDMAFMDWANNAIYEKDWKTELLISVQQKILIPDNVNKITKAKFYFGADCHDGIINGPDCFDGITKYLELSLLDSGGNPLSGFSQRIYNPTSVPLEFNNLNWAVTPGQKYSLKLRKQNDETEVYKNWLDRDDWWRDIYYDDCEGKPHDYYFVKQNPDWDTYWDRKCVAASNRQDWHWYQNFRYPVFIANDFPMYYFDWGTDPVGERDEYNLNTDDRGLDVRHNSTNPYTSCPDCTFSTTTASDLMGFGHNHSAALGTGFLARTAIWGEIVPSPTPTSTPTPTPTPTSAPVSPAINSIKIIPDQASGGVSSGAYGTTGLRTEEGGSNYYNALDITLRVDNSQQAALVATAFVKKGDNPTNLAGLMTSADSSNGFILLYARENKTVSGKSFTAGNYYVYFKGVWSGALATAVPNNSYGIDNINNNIGIYVEVLGGGTSAPRFSVKIFQSLGSRTWDTRGYVMNSSDNAESSVPKTPVNQ